MTVPLCLGCFRRHISMNGPVPRVADWFTARREETCTRCGRTTNNGIYVEEGAWT